MKDHERTMLRQAKRRLEEYKVVIFHLAVQDEEHHICERIQQLANDPDPKKAVLEMITISRDISLSPFNEFLEVAIFNDIEIALSPEKRETSYEIVYREDLTLTEKAKRLCLHMQVNDTRREIFNRMAFADLSEAQAIYDKVSQRLGISDFSGN